MKASYVLMAAALALAFLAGSAHAGFATTFDHVNTVEIDSTTYNVYDMMVSSAYDWEASQLSIWLYTGEFYNDSLGSDTQPTAAAIALAPDLEWDTYAATPSGETTPASFTPGSQFGQNPGTTDPPMGNTVIEAGWSDTAYTPGTFKVARLTLSYDAAGSIDGRSGFSSRWPGGTIWHRINGIRGIYHYIDDGHIVAESPRLPGDCDGSGFIDDDDLAIVLGNWEQDPGTISTWELGDFTGDTDVDDDDLWSVLNGMRPPWGDPPLSPPGASVPEPATLSLLALAPLAVMRRRRG